MNPSDVARASGFDRPYRGPGTESGREARSRATFSYMVCVDGRAPGERTMLRFDRGSDEERSTKEFDTRQIKRKVRL